MNPRQFFIYCPSCGNKSRASELGIKVQSVIRCRCGATFYYDLITRSPLPSVPRVPASQ